MVARNYLVMRKGKILGRFSSKDNALKNKRVLTNVGITGISVVKKKK